MCIRDRSNYLYIIMFLRNRSDNRKHRKNTSFSVASFHSLKKQPSTIPANDYSKDSIDMGSETGSPATTASYRSMRRLRNKNLLNQGESIIKLVRLKPLPNKHKARNKQPGTRKALPSPHARSKSISMRKGSLADLKGDFGLRKMNAFHAKADALISKWKKFDLNLNDNTTKRKLRVDKLSKNMNWAIKEYIADISAENWQSRRDISLLIKIKARNKIIERTLSKPETINKIHKSMIRRALFVSSLGKRKIWKPERYVPPKSIVIASSVEGLNSMFNVDHL
eukprot:TRINITY_DN3388_c0_g1_i6.p1 TRINITY_DN3388_c0_g1~~TRINITY_DN3388_c0_g1_i6.p1  ORF type:complete len:281 (+),score=36.05 TRINITY_DN3388_c0_g1_i6:77-919(+)